MFTVHLLKKKDIVDLGRPEKFLNLGLTTYSSTVSLEAVFEEIYSFLNSPTTITDPYIYDFRDEEQKTLYEAWVLNLRKKKI